MDPTNYWGYLSPVQPVTAGIDALQQQQVQSAQRSLASQQIQRQMQQQALGDAALKDALQNPGPQTYQNLLLLHPQDAAAIKTAYDSMKTEDQQSTLRDLTAVHNYLGANQTDQASAILQNHIDAAKRAGQDTASYDALLNTIKTNPQGAQVLAGTLLAGSVGADKMAETMASVGGEQRAQQAEPGKEALTAAQTAQANAEAAAKTNPPPKTAVNSFTGQYYNENAAPPAAALTSNNGAMDSLVQRLIQSESGGNATAKNPNSSATGAGQFLSGTWVPLISQLHPDLVQGKTQQQILDLRNNPQLAAEATAAYAQNNAQALGAAGLPVNGATIAMAHRLGPQGAQAVLGAAPNAPLSSVLPADVIAANPQYAKMTAGQLGQQLAGQFGTTPIDATPGDPMATGDAYLKTLPPERARQVKAIADGDLPLPTGRAAASGPGQMLAQQVLQYDPTASTINLATRQQTRKAFTSGTQGQSIVQANTVGGHLAALDGLADALNNGNVPLFNSVAQTVETATGNTSKQKAVTNFNTLSNTLASELTKFYRNNGGSEQDVKEFRSQLNPTNSPTQIHAAIQQMAGAVLSKIGALNDSYNAGMGKTTDGLNLPNVNHNAIAQLQRLAGDSSLGGGSPQAAQPQVYVNQQGQRIAYDAASKSWKPVS